MTKKPNLRKFVLAGILVLISITAHFLPFERASLAPDDYASLVRSQDQSVSILNYAERPVNYFFLRVQSILIGDNANYGFILLLASSLFLLICVFMLLNELLRDEVSAFLSGVVFCLLANTLEIYHTAIFANMNFAFSVYVLCLLFYLWYLDSGRITLLLLSLLFYATGIFWYEVGFFTPLIMFVALLLKRQRPFSWLLFLPLSVVYIAYSLSGSFGLTVKAGEYHSASFAAVPFNLLELLHHYAGRYMARSVIYGFYKFPSIEMPWFFVICLLDIVIALFVVNLVRKSAPKKIPLETILLACAIFVFWVMPILFNGRLGVGGRHLVLPSLGIAILGLSLFNSCRRGRGIISGILVLLFLAVSQGNGWSQVVACRINAAVYNYLKENRQVLSEARYIIFDTKSFADKISFSFTDSDSNLLNTYYGAQAFEEWGLKSMARLAAQDRGKDVYVAKTRLQRYGRRIEFGIPKYQGYRSETIENVNLDAAGCFVVDYNAVYGSGLRSGFGIK